MAKTATPGVELEPIDRLGEKLKLLVAMVDRLRAEQTKAADENHRLARELDAMRARMSETEAARSEAVGLREERDVIRKRVSEMLEQLDALNL